MALGGASVSFLACCPRVASAALCLRCCVAQRMRRSVVVGAGRAAVHSSRLFFRFFFLVVPFVATRSQLEQEQERVWVRRVVVMTC